MHSRLGRGIRVPGGLSNGLRRRRKEPPARRHQREERRPTERSSDSNPPHTNGMAAQAGQPQRHTEREREREKRGRTLRRAACHSAGPVTTQGEQTCVTPSRAS